MNINDFYKTIPEKLHGNISVGQNEVTITHPDGKYTAYQLGTEIDSQKDATMPDVPVTKAKEVKSVNITELLTSLSKSK